MIVRDVNGMRMEKTGLFPRRPQRRPQRRNIARIRVTAATLPITGAAIQALVDAGAAEGSGAESSAAAVAWGSAPAAAGIAEDDGVTGDAEASILDVPTANGLVVSAANGLVVSTGNVLVESTADTVLKVLGLDPLPIVGISGTATVSDCGTAAPVGIGVKNDISPELIEGAAIFEPAPPSSLCATIAESTLCISTSSPVVKGVFK
jgi:hypothetical protein